MNFQFFLCRPREHTTSKEEKNRITKKEEEEENYQNRGGLCNRLFVFSFAPLCIFMCAFSFHPRMLCRFFYTHSCYIYCEIFILCTLHNHYVEAKKKFFVSPMSAMIMERNEVKCEM